MTNEQLPIKLYTVNEVAEMLGMCPTTINRYHRAGLLKGFQFNTRHIRYSQAQIDEFLDNYKNKSLGD